MKKTFTTFGVMIALLVSLVSLTFFIGKNNSVANSTSTEIFKSTETPRATRAEISTPSATPYAVVTKHAPSSATPSVLPTPESAPSKDFHIKLPSGLSIDAYELLISPMDNYLETVPVSRSFDEIQQIHADERYRFFQYDSIQDGTINLMTQLNHDVIVARVKYTNYPTPTPGALASASVEVYKNDEIVYVANAGVGSPITQLRSLWGYAGNWLLEYVHVTVMRNEVENVRDYNATGHLVENGLLLNVKYEYDEIFGFQLLYGAPFFFFEKDEEIGISFNGQVTMLGFDEVPHYLCCGSAVLNPASAQNMVSFHAIKDNTWYYVEIGVYE